MESYGRETVASTAIMKIAQDARIAKCWVFVGGKCNNAIIKARCGKVSLKHFHLCYCKY